MGKQRPVPSDAATRLTLTNPEISEFSNTFMECSTLFIQTQVHLGPNQMEHHCGDVRQPGQNRHAHHVNVVGGDVVVNEEVREAISTI